MHLLYVDESGTVSDPNQKHFVLSGISVPEKKTYWIEQDMNQIASRFDANDPYNMELHGSPMRAGNKEWRPFKQRERIQAIKDCLQLIADSRGDIRIFASVVEQGAHVQDDVINHSFMQIASRFDMFLGRLHSQNNTQRGIAIFDKSSTEKSIQHLARTFRDTGHNYGQLRNFSEVPVFLDSKASRLIQLADLVAYAIFRKFEKNDPTFYSIIERCFDFNNGQQHGLYVLSK
ncbi:DUF3800 domain-containing protein [Acinetobacter baumannii]|nr:DUF3800 domain-containing protein [Acinetobacter baumannii]